MASLTAMNARGGLGSVFGTSRQAPFDRWFRYPAGFNQGALDLVLEPTKNKSGGSVIDPFAGSGTVGTAATSRGWGFRGIEAHPEIAELAQLKLSRYIPDSSGIVEHAQAIVESCLAASVVVVASGEADLVNRCFDPTILAQLVELRGHIQASSEWTSPYLKWALLATLRDVANVKVGWPYLRPSLPRRPPFSDVRGRFLARAGWMAEDLAQRAGVADGQMVRGDSRHSASWTDIKGTLCVTSPPYLNNFDYADATRLETYFWGRNASWAEMCSDVRAGMLVATTQQASLAGAEEAVETLVDSWPDLAVDVRQLSSALARAGEGRQRPKEYDRVLPQYLLGIQSVLLNLMQVVDSGTWCAWVIGDSAPYGVFVDTPALIARCAETQGFEAFECVHLRTRGDRWRTNGSRHQVTLSEKLLWFRAP